MNFITENLPLILECVRHIAYILAVAAAVTCALIYRDMYKTTKEDLKTLRNVCYARATDPELSAETSKELGVIYREISELIRTL